MQLRRRHHELGPCLVWTGARGPDAQKGPYGRMYDPTLGRDRLRALGRVAALLRADPARLGRRPQVRRCAVRGDPTTCGC
jgi:hypothetical protein